MAMHGTPGTHDPPQALSAQQLLELQLDDVQRVAHVGIWELALDSDKLVWSDETFRILGIDPAQAGSSVDMYMSVVHPEDRDKVLALVEQARQAPFHPALEHRVVRPDGEIRHVFVRGFPFQAPDGLALSGTVQDITEIRQSNEALEAKSRQLLNTLESMAEAFYTLDKDWRFTYLNPEAERVLQHPRETLLGKVLWDEFEDLHGTRFETEFRQAVATGRPASFEALYVPFNSWKEMRVFPSAEGLAVYFTDISERKRLEEVERENAERFRVVARATSDVIWDWDTRIDRLWWSEGIESMFGYAPGEFDDGIAVWANRVHPEERERVVGSLFRAVKTLQEHWREEYRFQRKDGSWAQVRDHGILVRDDGRVLHMIGAMVDVTAQKQLEADQRQAEARYRLQASLLDKAHDAISVSDVDGRITYWNNGAQRLFGWTADEALGKTRAELLIVSNQEFVGAHETVLRQGDWTGELRKRRKDGNAVTVECHMTLVRDDDGHPQAVLAIDTDITQRKEAEKEILSLAFFDPLTRLPNRRLLLDRLGHALAACRRTGRMGALLFLDLDNFKSLNDTLGHDMGDMLLEQVAQRLTAQVPRGSDTVARHGGDEFVVLLEDLGSQQRETAARAERVAEKILAVFHQPFQLQDHQYHTSPSIGVALYDKHIGDVDELLKRADLAMYQAKGAGRNTIRFFDLEMQTVINLRVELEADLRHGLQHQEFCLFYQRQTDVDGRTIGAEALVRWLHPRRKLVLPEVFIPLAEETGLIMQLGLWVLESACRQLVAWAGNPATSHLTVAVNVSARQFRQPAFVSQVLDVLDRTGADPRRLKLELTESLLLANVDATIDNMHQLKEKGIGFALDDFGTGYSSLSYLKRLPLDQLKIDQSFVHDVLSDPNDAAIARTILGLGHTLGLDVIAEGVETQHQRDFLAAHGCRAYQGYLFGPPVEAAQF